MEHETRCGLHYLVGMEHGKMNGESVGGNKRIEETLTTYKVKTSNYSCSDRFVILYIICYRRLLNISVASSYRYVYAVFQFTGPAAKVKYILFFLCVCVCVCVRVRVRARARARARVRVCVCVCVRARACVYKTIIITTTTEQDYCYYTGLVCMSRKQLY